MTTRFMVNPVAARQLVRSQPSWWAHGTVGLLCLGLVGIMVWAAYTPVDVAVQATGQMVSPTGPVPVRLPEQADIGMRVTKLWVHEGKQVEKDEVLFELDTRQLLIREEEKERQRGMLELNLSALDSQKKTLQETHAKAILVAEKDVEDARTRVAEERMKKEALKKSIEAEYKFLRDETEKTRRLVNMRLEKADALTVLETKVTKWKAYLEAANIPVSEKPVEVCVNGVAWLKSKNQAEMRELEIRTERVEGDFQRTRQELAELRRLKETARVRAPVKGIVGQCALKPDVVLERAKPALYLHETSDTFEMLVAREELEQVQVGTTVAVCLEDVARRKHAPISGQVISLGVEPVATSSRPLYPVRVQLNRENPGAAAEPLRSGQSGSGEIVLTRQPLLAVIFGDLRHTVKFQ